MPATSRIRIRPARARDARALAALRYAQRAETGGATEERGRFLRRCESWMQGRLRRTRRWRAWVVVEGRELVGHVWLHLMEKIPNPVRDEPEQHGYITNLYVVPRLRGGGIGGRLLSTALGSARAGSVDVAFLWPSPKSRPLYERAGFSASSDILMLRVGPGRSKKGGKRLRTRRS